MMLEELQRRNFSQTTVKTYLKVVEDFSRHFHRPPDQLGKDHIRAYQVYLFQERKLGVRTVGLHTAALAKRRRRDVLQPRRVIFLFISTEAFESPQSN